MTVEIAPETELRTIRSRVHEVINNSLVDDVHTCIHSRHRDRIYDLGLTQNRLCGIVCATISMCTNVVSPDLTLILERHG